MEIGNSRSPDWRQRVLHRIHHRIQELLDKLPMLANPQIALALFKSCGSYCKLSHLARTTPPELSAGPLRDFDNKIRKCFDESMVINTPDRAWHQAQLPLRLGGMGLRSLGDHGAAAYIASLNISGTSNKESLEAAVDAFNTKLGEDARIPKKTTSSTSQQKLSARIDEHSQKLLLLNATIADQARWSPSPHPTQRTGLEPYHRQAYSHPCNPTEHTF
jgi:hypothetical protein